MFVLIGRVDILSVNGINPPESNANKLRGRKHKTVNETPYTKIITIKNPVFTHKINVGLQWCCLFVLFFEGGGGSAC